MTKRFLPNALSLLQAAMGLVTFPLTAAALPGACPPRTTCYHVAPGAVHGLGTLGRPFGTLEEARDAVRANRKGGIVGHRNGVVVFLHAGIYERAEPLVLGPEDSGTRDASVIWRPWLRADVRIRGATALSGLQPLSDTAAWPAVGQATYPHLRQISLAAHGVKLPQSPPLKRCREPFFEGPSGLGIVLFQGDQTLRLARWPNDGWAFATATLPAAPPTPLPTFAKATPSPGPPPRLTYGHAVEWPAHWTSGSEVWVDVFWWDYSHSYELVTGVDTASSVLTVDGLNFPLPEKEATPTACARWAALNVLSELDKAGEYYIDRGSDTLLVWPPDTSKPVYASTLVEPLMKLDGASHVSLQGITFEMSMLHGVTISGGSDNLITGCTFRNLGGIAVAIDESPRSSVRSSHIYQTDRGIGIGTNENDDTTQALAENNHIHDCDFWCRSRGIQIAGANKRVTGNVITDMDDMAIEAGGRDNEIDHNHIRAVARERGDYGAIYLGSETHCTRVHHNYFERIYSQDAECLVDNEPVTLGRSAIYLDNCASHNTIEENFFSGLDDGVWLFGGHDNTIEGNVFDQVGVSVLIAKSSCSVGGAPQNNLIKRNRACDGDSFLRWHGDSACPPGLTCTICTDNSATSAPHVYVADEVPAALCVDRWIAGGCAPPSGVGTNAKSGAP